MYSKNFLRNRKYSMIINGIFNINKLIKIETKGFMVQWYNKKIRNESEGIYSTLG